MRQSAAPRPHLVAAILAWGGVGLSCGGSGPAPSPDAAVASDAVGATDSFAGDAATARGVDAGGGVPADTERTPDTERPFDIERIPEAGRGEWLPGSTFDLYGRWAIDDSGTVRALQFEALTNRFRDLVGQSPVYGLYKYPTGKVPVLVERGTFKMEPGPWLVLKPTWNTDGAPLQAVEWPVLPAPVGQLALKTPAGVRVYQHVVALP